MRSARAMARRARGAGRSKPKSSDATRSTLFDADPTLAQRPQAQSPLSSVRMGRTEPSVFAEFSELSDKFNAVNLGQGFPDYAMPDFVKEAAVEAIRADYNQYSRPAGHARRRRRLARGDDPGAPAAAQGHPPLLPRPGRLRAAQPQPGEG